MAIAEQTRHKFDVDEFYRIYEAGVFHEDDRIELIDGEILHMTPIGIKHIACVNRLNELFMARFRKRAIVSIQNPVRLSKVAEPEPDIALLKYREDFYTDGHPSANDILLIVEVADSSVEYDRNLKLPQYAKNKIPEVWLVNINEEHVEIYRDPSGDEFLKKTILKPRQFVCSLAFEEEQFCVGDMMPWLTL